MHYYQWNIGDYIKHTAHLTLEEDITYRRLLDYYYDTEQPITQNNPLVSRKLRVPEKALQTILDEFFVLTENGYINLRADAEIAQYYEFIEKQKANGIKGGRPKKTHRLPTANPSQTQAEPKITLNTIHNTLNNNKGQGDKSPFVLNEKIPKAAWQDWHDYRNSQKGWTGKAKQLSANSLLALIEKGHDAQTIVNKSIENGWKGLFEPKTDKFQKPEVRPSFTKVEKTPEQIAQDKAEAQRAFAEYQQRLGVTA